MGNKARIGSVCVLIGVVVMVIGGAAGLAFAQEDPLEAYPLRPPDTASPGATLQSFQVHTREVIRLYQARELGVAFDRARARALRGLLCGCSSEGTTYGSSVSYVYDDWLYHHYDWYDDDFWIWVDDHPDCCDDEDDIEEALRNWYDDLDPDQQQAVRDRVQTWMDEHGVVPAAGQSGKDLVLETASERWAALTPAERQQWLDQRRSRIEQRRVTASASQLTSDQRAVLSERAANLSPEQRAALRESAQGTSFDRVSGRGAAGGVHRSINNHPTPHARWSVRRHALPRRARRRSRGTGTRPIVLPRARSKQAELIGIWKRVLGRNATDLAHKPGVPRIAPCPLSDRRGARSGAPGRRRRWPPRNATAGAIARPSTGIAQPAAGRFARSDRACLPYRTGANLTVSGRYPGMPVHFAGVRQARRVAKMSSVPAV
jgi:hypothetical protein